MTSEKLLKIILWGTSALSTVALGLLIYIYASGSASGSNKFQAWACLGICLAATFNSRAQLNRKRKK